MSREAAFSTLKMRTRHPCAPSIGDDVFQEFGQLNMKVLVFTESHALSVKKNLGKFSSNRSLNIFSQKHSFAVRCK